MWDYIFQFSFLVMLICFIPALLVLPFYIIKG